MRLLDTISRALTRWDAATRLPAYRYTGLALALALGAALLLAPSPAGLSPGGWQTLAVLVVMALLWVARILPLAVTALLPLVAFPVLGVLPLSQVAAAYAHPLNLLMLGGFVLGHGMEEAGVHRRVVAALLGPRWVRGSPRRVLLAVMVAGAGLSALISNTATTLMLLPVALEVARRCTDDRRQRTAFVLGLAYAASLGGVATLIGTPPNAILAGLDPRITFAGWAGIGVPFALLALPVAWGILGRVGLPLPPGFDADLERPRAHPWTAAEAGVVGVVGLAFLGWFSRSDLPLAPGWTVPGWGGLLPAGAAHDALVAVGAAGLLFLLPALPRDRRAHEGHFLLRLRRLERGVPWSVLVLLGGGFALAAGVEASGLTPWLAGATGALADLQAWGGDALTVLALCLGMSFLTELTSNTATTAILLPVLAAGAAQAGVEPLLWMVPATLSASCAFMMPVATAPNAIAAQAGGVAPGDMAFTGLLLNLAIAGVAAAVVLFLAPAFG